jgi:hypothetical protein
MFTQADSTVFSAMNQIISLLAALGVGGLLGTVISNWLTTKRERVTRHHQSQLRKLKEFYGPLLSLHTEIRAKSELRVKVQQAVDRMHAEAMLEAGPAGVEQASDEHLPGILQTIADENQTFREILMPLYRDMVRIFRENMWLAEPETRDHFPALVEFVDIWDKILSDRIPRSVAPAIGHTEENLKPFYANLAATHDRLRVELGM